MPPKKIKSRSKTPKKESSRKPVIQTASSDSRRSSVSMQNYQRDTTNGTNASSSSLLTLGFPETTNITIDVEHQAYAALTVLPLSTFGWFCMLFGYNYYLGHKFYDHLEYAMWPSAAFCTMFLLWHRYQKSGWRRNLDIFMTNTAILVQTYKIVVTCDCHVHRSIYLSAFGIGTLIYILGVFTPEFSTGVKWHVTTHLIAYMCNVILYRCIAN